MNLSTSQQQCMCNMFVQAVRSRMHWDTQRRYDICDLHLLIGCRQNSWGEWRLQISKKPVQLTLQLRLKHIHWIIWTPIFDRPQSHSHMEIIVSPIASILSSTTQDVHGISQGCCFPCSFVFVGLLTVEMYMERTLPFHVELGAASRNSTATRTDL